jgi:hypothetical protein
MKTHGTVQKPMTLGQQKELTSALVEAIPTNLSFDQATYWIGKKTKLGSELRKLLVGSKDTVSEELQIWIYLYRECFGLELDLSIFQIPEYQENTWIVPVHVLLTEQIIYDACKKRFNCDKSVDLTKITDVHRKGTTVRRFKANVEADEEYKNKSANNLQKEGLEQSSITLKERMLLELWYFKTTGKHLDLNNWTLCNGSRDAGGYVPDAHWGGGSRKFYVFWHDVDSSVDSLRSRVAVS